MVHNLDYGMNLLYLQEKWNPTDSLRLLMETWPTICMCRELDISLATSVIEIKFSLAACTEEIRSHSLHVYIYWRNWALNHYRGNFGCSWRNEALYKDTEVSMIELWPIVTIAMLCSQLATESVGTRAKLNVAYPQWATPTVCTPPKHHRCPRNRRIQFPTVRCRTPLLCLRKTMLRLPVEQYRHKILWSGSARTRIS